MYEAIPVTRSSMPGLEEYIEEIRPVWESRWLTNMGQKHQQLERELCQKLKVPYLALFTNGHLALECAIQSLELSGEVITSPFTFASSTQAIVRSGLTPVFCDVTEEDLTLDPDKIEALITPRTTAILPIHVYGNICRVQEIDKIAERHGLKVIYDAAHAFGEELDGQGVGNFGDLTMFSFHATKVFHTIEGGAVACHDERARQKLSALKNFGQYSQEDVGEVGGNAKMNEFQAAMGLCNLRHVDGEIALRRQAAMRYRERLDGVPGLRLISEQKGVKANYAYLPLLIDPKRFGEDRDALCGRLRGKGIFLRKYFYPLTSDFGCYAGKFERQETPVARQAAKSVVTLPLYAGLAAEDVDRVCDAVLEGRR